MLVAVRLSLRLQVESNESVNTAVATGLARTLGHRRYRVKGVTS